MFSVYHLSASEEGTWPAKCLCGKVIKKQRKRRIWLPFYCVKCTEITVGLCNGDDLTKVVDLSMTRTDPKS